MASPGDSRMNRFFSKLDLRDIKIDPTGTRFPPEEEGYEERELPAETVTAVAASPVAEPIRPSYAPAWATSVPVAPVEETPAEAERLDGEVARCGEVLKVSARSRPSAVAGAIAG